MTLDTTLAPHPSDATTEDRFAHSLGEPSSHVRAVGVRLRDGSQIELVPLEMGDREAILNLLEGLSERSRTFRFASPTPSLSETQKRHLTEIDGHDHFAWGAYHDGVLIGLARSVRFPFDPGCADVAITVADSYHGLGIGSLLLEALAAIAPTLGIERLGYSVLGSNRKAIRLLARFGGRFEYSDGMGEGILPVEAFGAGRLPIDQLLRSAKQSPDQVSSMAQILKSTRPESSPVLRTSA